MPQRTTPTIIDRAKAFGAVDAILERLSAGWIHEANDVPAFYDAASGKWHPVVPALRGWISLWGRLRDKFAPDLDLAPLVELSNRLHLGQDITPELVDYCKNCVFACKRAYRSMDLVKVWSVVRTELTQSALLHAGAIPPPDPLMEKPNV